MMAALSLFSLSHAAFIGGGSAMRHPTERRSAQHLHMRTEPSSGEFSPEATARAAAVISCPISGPPVPGEPAASDTTEVQGSEYTIYEKVLEVPPTGLGEDETGLVLSQLAAASIESPAEPPTRGVFATRSLDMNLIKVIGYDMVQTARFQLATHQPAPSPARRQLGTAEWATAHPCRRITR